MRKEFRHSGARASALVFSLHWKQLPAPLMIMEGKRVSKSVIVDFKIRLRCDEHPDDATKNSVNFRYNESTWCADNLLEELQKLKKRLKGGCLCNAFQGASYVRDATKEDL